MAWKVTWSNEATDDLDALAEYIASDSSFYAAAFAQEILDVAAHSTSLLKDAALFQSLAIRIFENSSSENSA